MKTAFLIVLTSLSFCLSAVSALADYSPSQCERSCTPQIACGACDRGRQNCKVINCQGQVSSEYYEACQELLQYACNSCELRNPYINDGKEGYGYYVAVYLGNQQQYSNGSALFKDLDSCQNARQSDYRCK